MSVETEQKAICCFIVVVGLDDLYIGVLMRLTAEEIRWPLVSMQLPSIFFFAQKLYTVNTNCSFSFPPG